MQRRQFLLGVAGTALAAPFGIAHAVQYQQYLGQPWQVPSGTTLEVWPAQVGLDLPTVLDATADWSVPVSSRLVIRMPDGDHYLQRSLYIQHISGKRMSIIGNRNDPSRCRLLWSGASDLVYAGAGSVLGLIDGFTAEHASPGRRGNGSAFLADEGGVILCGPKIRAVNFYYGFQARAGGVIRCDGSESSGGGDCNYFAFNGGHINASRSRASGARDSDKNLGSGFVAEYGGTINAPEAVASYNLLAGFTALSNGVIRAYGSQALNNGQAGYYANTGGAIVAHAAIARSNCGEGLKRGERPSGITGNQIISIDNGNNPRTCIQR